MRASAGKYLLRTNLSTNVLPSAAVASKEPSTLASSIGRLIYDELRMDRKVSSDNKSLFQDSRKRILGHNLELK